MKRNRNHNYTLNLFDDHKDGNNKPDNQKSSIKKAQTIKRFKQNIRSSSKESYQLKMSNGSHQTETIRAIQTLKKLGKASRRMIAKESGIPENHMTRIIYNAIKKGVVEELPDKMECQVQPYRKVFYVQLLDCPQNIH